MNNMQQQLVDLKDIHLPHAMPWWDIALGWWLLMLCTLLLVVALVYGLPRMVKKYRLWQQHKALGIDITRELQAIKMAYAQDKNHHALVEKLSIFLRRISLTLFRDKVVAGLVGRKWVVFLDSVWVAEKPEPSFTDQRIMDILAHAAYQPMFEESQYQDAQALLDLSTLWSQEVIKHHV